MSLKRDQVSTSLESWTTKTIGDVASYVRGVAYDKSLSRMSPSKGFTPLLRATNIDSGALILQDFVYVPKDIVKSEQLLQIGDLVIAASSGSSSVVGKSAPVLTDFSGTFGAFCAVLRAGESISNRYLGYYIQAPSVRELWSSLARGTNINNLKRDQVCSTSIAVPPLAEQIEIVWILEEQFARLDAAAASIAAVRRKADQFRRSLLSAAFSGELSSMIPGCSQQRAGWERKHLGDCLEKLKSGKLVERGWSPQCLNNPSGDEDTWGVLKTTAVQMGEFQPEHNKELPLALEPKSALEVEDGDFLLITTSPRSRCGIVCQVKSTRPKLIFSGKILRFRINEEKLLADWLMFYLMSPENQEVLDSLKVGTSDSSVSIGNKQILDLEVPIASMEEQKIVSTLVAEELSRISSLLDLANTAERRVSVLRRSLLQAAFTGELTKEWREKNNG